MTTNGLIEIDERRGLPSASGMERIVLCPGSWRAEQSAPPETESEWAAEGTKLHAVLAGELSGDDLSEDQQWVVDRCREIEAGILEAVAVDALFTVREERMWYTSGDVCHYSGKPDVAYWDGGDHTLVIDYKTGRGEVAPAETNYQMRALAVLVARRFGGVRTVFVGLVHPRYRNAEGETFTLARYEREDLELADSEINAALAAALEPNAPRVPGTSQCRYCRAKALCPEARALAVGSPGSIEAVAANGLPALTGEDLASLLPKLSVAEKIIAAIRAQAKALLEAGGEIPGWMLKPGSVRRAITDPQAAYDRLAELITPEQFAGACTVALGKLETAVKDATGIKGKALKELLAEKLDGVIESKQSAPSLAPCNEIAAEVEG